MAPHRILTCAMVAVASTPSLLAQPSVPAMGTPAPPTAPAPLGQPKAAASPLPFGERWKVRLNYGAMQRAMGYYASRLSILDRIGKEFPQFTEQASTARKALAEHYDPAAELLRTLMRQRDSKFDKDWEAFKSNQLISQTAKAPLSAETLKGAFESGAFDPPRQSVTHMAVLNSFHPAFMADHEKELEQFGRAAGITIPNDPAHWISVRAPSSWASIAPKDSPPGTGMIASNAGMGPASVRIDLLIFPGEGDPSPQKLSDLLEALPRKDPNDRLRPVTTARVGDDLTAFRSAEATKVTSDGKKMYSRSTISLFVRDKLMIVLTMSVWDIYEPDEPPPTPDDFERVEDQYRAIFNSMHTGLKLEPRPKSPDLNAAPTPSPDTAK